MNLNSSIDAIKFISSNYKTLLAKISIFTVKDLITYFPSFYSDNSEIISIKYLEDNGEEKKDYVLKGRFINLKNTYLRSGKTIQTAKFKDDSGEVRVTWFNQPYIINTLGKDSDFLIKARIKRKPKSIELFPNIYEQVLGDKESVHMGRITPEYRLTEGITKKWLRNRIKFVTDRIEELNITDETKDVRMSEFDINQLIKQSHFPESEEILAKALEELSLIEITNIHLKVMGSKSKIKNNPLKIDKKKIIEPNDFEKNLSFNLTADQKKIIESLFQDLKNSKTINCLLQGDVRSGKTIVSIYLALNIASSGYQVAILAPTTILAKQHFESFNKIINDKNISIELITAAEKQTKPADIFIGTSALLKRKIQLFKNIGAVIVDEQHKFGVSQREELLDIMDLTITEKSVNFMNMTATPIPRTIAQIFFDDIDVYTIKSKPIGRKPIKTFLIPKEKRVDSYNWIEKELNKGSQVFWVCPLVFDSDTLKVESVEAVGKKLEKQFANHKIRILHGKMKDIEKNILIEDFRNHKFDILVSTTVIEVGIDIANASIMIIENAERFGLAQLHQIRGRVGRGDNQSWCFLFYADEISDLAHKRLDFLSKSTDGLAIAQFDLETRGPGEIYGVKQSGIPNLKIAKLDNLELITKAKQIAISLYKKGIKNIELFS